MRSLCLIGLMCVGAVATACGGGSSAAHKHNAARPGSPQNPLVAHAQEGTTSEGGAAKRPDYSYQSLVERQTSTARSDFTPCNLVTSDQAAAIVGPIRAPVEAPQGPTCIYRSRDGKSFVTLALQNLDFAKLKHQIHRPVRTRVSSRTAYCGSYGQPTLFVPLSGGRVLSITGQCAVARRFALKALPRLPR